MEPDAARQQLAAALARVASGERAALRLVYRDTAAKLLASACDLRDDGEAEEVLQEVYITVWRRAATRSGSGEPDHVARGDCPQPRHRPAAGIAKTRGMRPIEDAFDVSDGSAGRAGAGGDE